ncbi:MAG: hypothetical protein Q9157_006521 [Trypethelium eluteriae]
MAEVGAVFGLVIGGAGLIALALELGKSAVKLRGIYRTMKEAPRLIADLADDLDTMELALRELEYHRQSDTHNGALLIRCILGCQKSTANIQQIMDKIVNIVTENSTPSGRVYTAFRDAHIKKLLDDLERAKSSLQLAFTMYLVANQKSRDQAHSDTLAFQNTLLSGPQAQVSASNTNILHQLTRLFQTLTSPSQPHMNPYGALETTATTSNLKTLKTVQAAGSHLKQCGDAFRDQRFKEKQGERCFQFRFQLPTWLCCRIWDVAIITAQCGWTAHLRTYNVIPEESLIFRYAEHGDVARVRNLIENGEGSPLDVMQFNVKTWTFEPSRQQPTLIEVSQDV